MSNLEPLVVAGTGHRPDKLGGYSRESVDRLVAFAEQSIDLGIQYHSRPLHIISGGALGWDQALAQGALRTGSALTLALPFKGFESKWPKESQDYLHRIIEKANEIVYVSDEGYAPWKMQVRNVWMVDHSDEVWALWNGTSGGTANAVAYAKKRNKLIRNHWNDYEQFED